MNMLARALPSGRLIDPYGGEADIRERRIDILAAGNFQRRSAADAAGGAVRRTFRVLDNRESSRSDDGRRAAGNQRFGRANSRRAGKAFCKGAQAVDRPGAAARDGRLGLSLAGAARRRRRRAERVARLRRLDSLARDARRIAARRSDDSFSGVAARRRKAANEGRSPFLSSRDRRGRNGAQRCSSAFASPTRS